MERFIRNAKGVTKVGGVKCPGLGGSLTLLSWDGGETTFGLINGRIASNGGEISASEIQIQELMFECIRIEGVPDQVKISFEAMRNDVSGGVNTTSSYETRVNLRNY